jgi:hypothetical protein
MRSVGIVGLGSYVPEKVLTNFDLEKIVETSDEWITTRTGIKERRVAAAHETTTTMAIEAAKSALDDAGVSANEVDLIIVATVTPDYFFPSTACQVQHAIGAPNAAAFDLLVGCTWLRLRRRDGVPIRANGRCQLRPRHWLGDADSHRGLDGPKNLRPVWRWGWCCGRRTCARGAWFACF